MSFENFNFDHKINAAINTCGYETPTPIQLEAIPQVLQGRDIMGLAQTGTGKTAAFVLPMLQKLLQGPRRKVRAVIVAPTRELAEQIHANITTLGRGTGLNSVTVYGGVGKGGQLQMFRAGVEIIVACPGRLLDHLDSKDLRLDGVEMLVLDEADMMFDMGFMPAIKRLLKYLPKQRQNMLFSATMPDAIRDLAGQILVDPVRVQVDQVKPADTVSHVLMRVEQQGKTALLMSLVKEPEVASALIFTRTKHKARSLALVLEKDGHRAVALQGNMSQNKRKAAMDGFRRGRFNILVATDIAARGIDVSGISHVINYDVPDTLEAYTHRIGRTGRAQSRGEAITFAGREDSGFIRQVERSLNSRMICREGMEIAAEAVCEPAHLQWQGEPVREKRSSGGNRPKQFNNGPTGRSGKTRTDKPANRDGRKAQSKEGFPKTAGAKRAQAPRGRRPASLGIDFLSGARRRG